MHPPQSAGCATIRSATSSCKWQQNNGIKGVSPMQLRRISFTVADTLLLAAQAPALAADSGKTMIHHEVGKPRTEAQMVVPEQNYDQTTPALYATEAIRHEQRSGGQEGTKQGRDWM